MAASVMDVGRSPGPTAPPLMEVRKLKAGLPVLNAASMRLSIRKTLVEAFVKLVVCRRITVQTIAPVTGRVLHSHTTQEEDSPVILDVHQHELSDVCSGPSSNLQPYGNTPLHHSFTRSTTTDTPSSHRTFVDNNPADRQNPRWNLTDRKKQCSGSTGNRGGSGEDRSGGVANGCQPQGRKKPATGDSVANGCHPQGRKKPDTGDSVEHGSSRREEEELVKQTPVQEQGGQSGHQDPTVCKKRKLDCDNDLGKREPEDIEACGQEGSRVLDANDGGGGDGGQAEIENDTDTRDQSVSPKSCRGKRLGSSLLTERKEESRAQDEEHTVTAEGDNIREISEEGEDPQDDSEHATVQPDNISGQQGSEASGLVESGDWDAGPEPLSRNAGDSDTSTQQSADLVSLENNLSDVQVADSEAEDESVTVFMDAEGNLTSTADCVRSQERYTEGDEWVDGETESRDLLNSDQEEGDTGYTSQHFSTNTHQSSQHSGAHNHPSSQHSGAHNHQSSQHSGANNHPSSQHSGANNHQSSQHFSANTHQSSQHSGANSHQSSQHSGGDNHPSSLDFNTQSSPSSQRITCDSATAQIGSATTPRTPVSRTDPDPQGAERLDPFAHLFESSFPPLDKTHANEPPPSRADPEPSRPGTSRDHGNSRPRHNIPAGGLPIKEEDPDEDCMITAAFISPPQRKKGQEARSASHAVASPGQSVAPGNRMRVDLFGRPSQEGSSSGQRESTLIPPPAMFHPAAHGLQQTSSAALYQGSSTNTALELSLTQTNTDYLPNFLASGGEGDPRGPGPFSQLPLVDAEAPHLSSGDPHLSARPGPPDAEEEARESQVGRGDFSSHQATYQCSLCLKRFFHRHKFQAHAVMCGGQRPFKCRICCKGFNQRAHLDTHLKFHVGIKRHRCDLCRKAYVMKGDLIRHLKTRVHRQALQNQGGASTDSVSLT